jgi:epoxyqueuosine reductase
VRQKAHALGFHAVGFARADVPLEGDLAAYDRFVAAGMHGEMAWLAKNRQARERLDRDSILADAKSVICVAWRYQRSAEQEATDSPVAAMIARYARGRDYHGFLRRRIRRLAAFVRTLGSPTQPVHARPMCDDAPLLERAWAVRAGLGFVGKNGMLIVPGMGSMVLLGEVVTTLELVPAQESATAAADPAPQLRPGVEKSGLEKCGSCTRCLDACPTSAFAAPYVLDPRRCISYLTIEAKSTAAPELLQATGTHLFGCDDCQTVCPFNHGGARVRDGSEDRGRFSPLERWSALTLEDLLAMGDAGWRDATKGSPLKRAGRAGLARNAAVVLGNQREPMALGRLRAAAEGHPDAGVREAAAWAERRLKG